MVRSTALAASAAVITIVVGGLLFASRPSDPVVGAPTDQPSPAASDTSPSPSVGPPVAAALEARWLSGTRALDGLDTEAGTSVVIGRGRLALTSSVVSQAALLSAAVTAGVSDDQFHVVSTSDDRHCRIGDSGTYRWSLSPGGTRLTVAALDDVCSARGSALSGEWTRVDCVDPENFCLGQLEAGTYASQYFRPDLPSGQGWSPKYGALNFNVPGGWAAGADWPDRYRIERASFYAEFGTDTNPRSDGIYLFGQPAAATQTSDCSGVQAPDVGRTAADLAGFLASHPGLDSTAPEPITIDGHDGLIVDVSVRPDWTATCPGDAIPTAILFVSSREPNGYVWGSGANARDRYILLDLGPDATLVIDIGTSEGDFEALIAEAMPIVESFTFD